MDPLFWSILLLLLGLILMSLEVFVPSGGILGFLSATAVLTAIGLAFLNRGVEVGLIFLLVAVLAVPAVLATAFKYWPHTPMGRRVLLEVPTSEEVLPDTPQLRALRALVGKVGVAKSLMLPSGAILVDGMTVDAVSDGTAIEPGQRIRVLEVHGNRVVVGLTEDPITANDPAADPDDILSQPLESLGLEDEPLT